MRRFLMAALAAAVFCSSAHAQVTSGYGNLRVPSSAPAFGVAPVVGGSAVSSVIAKPAAGNLYSAYVTPTAAGWLMVFNATSLPGDGATTAGTASGGLQDCIYAPANSTTGVDYSSAPEVFTVGITVAFSSTACTTLTNSTVAFIHGSAK